ncbi:MAG TPA: ABC transporter ATP-binding protein [Oscillospiraceae bacterium]|nr:ABC transporter ATP-binding protein [Oscillospiraceae bacterium]
MKDVITVDQLSKSYGNLNVIDKISFSVSEGEIFALLGANGAGKTTTLECIEGIRSYDAGSITIDGTIGVQLQSSSLPANITVLEAYKLFCKWNHVREDPELLDTFGLALLKNKQYEAMSTGQKRRLHLVLALINNPAIIFLDEPTAGLDVEGRVALHTEIRKLKEQGKTIIMASHDMAEVESLCDRIAILKGGDIVFIGSSTELTSRYVGESKIFIKTQLPITRDDFKHSTYLATHEGYASVRTVSIGNALLELLNEAKENGNEVLDIKIERASLEQRFVEIATEGK